MPTTTNTIIFTTRKPNIIERIIGYFQLRKFEREFSKAKAVRAKLHEEIIAERRTL